MKTKRGKIKARANDDEEEVGGHLEGRRDKFRKKRSTDLRPTGRTHVTVGRIVRGSSNKVGQRSLVKAIG